MYIPSTLLLPLPPFVGLAAGSKAVLNLPVGPTYQVPSLYLRDAAGVVATKGEIQAGVDRIRVLVNGKTKWDVSGAEAVMLAEFHNSGSVANGTLPLYFAEPWQQVEAQGADTRPEGGFINQVGPAWGTAGLNSMTIELWIAAGVPGAEVVNAELYALQTEPTELGAHAVILRQTRSYAGVGTDRIIDAPRGQASDGLNDLTLKAIHIGDANVSNVEILADRSRLLYTPKTFVEQQYAALQGSNRRTPQTGWFSLDFTGFRNRIGDALKLSMRDLEIAVTFSVAPADYEVIYEVIDVHPKAK